MPPPTAQGKVFRCVHRVIFDELTIKFHIKYKNVGKYYKEIYKWFKPFANDIEWFEENNPFCCNTYLQAVPYTGLIKLITDKSIKSDFFKDYQYRVGSRYGLYNIENNAENIAIATKYLKATYSKVFAVYKKCNFNEVSDNIANMLAEKVLYTMETSEICSHDIISRIKSYFIKNSLTGFEKMAVVIIYAQNSKIPIVTKPNILHPPNIYMASKSEIQQKARLEYRSDNASRIVIINYAGTSFLASFSITNEVNNDWTAFMYNLMYRGTEIEIVLTDPNSIAAVDAEKYKMRPYTLNLNLGEIINQNINTLKLAIKNNKWTNVNYYLSDIAFPCAYFKSEFKDNSEKDNIKIDLYLPSFAQYVEDENGVLCATPKEQCDDMLRQSFMIYRKDNEKLYNVFSNNIEEILKHAKERTINPNAISK